jgi:predicted acyltransferase
MVPLNPSVVVSASDTKKTETTTFLRARVHSIDALRGFDMFFLMQEEPGFLLALFGAIHLPYRNIWVKELDHTEWIGFTFWDFIAPLFLFIVGIALPYALNRRVAEGESKKTRLSSLNQPYTRRRESQLQ